LSSAITTLSLAEHPFAPVTCTVYVPGALTVTPCDVELPGVQRYV
jgi:hypothetical protein